MSIGNTTEARTRGPSARSPRLYHCASLLQLASNKGIHITLDEFKFLPNWTTDSGTAIESLKLQTSTKSYNGENGLSYPLLFLIRSF